MVATWAADHVAQHDASVPWRTPGLVCRRRHLVPRQPPLVFLPDIACACTSLPAVCSVDSAVARHGSRMQVSPTEVLLPHTQLSGLLGFSLVANMHDSGMALHTCLVLPRHALAKAACPIA